MLHRRAELTHGTGRLRPSNAGQATTIFRTLAVLLVAASTAGAQEAPTSRDAVDAKALPDYTGKETPMISVEYLEYPLRARRPVHRHDTSAHGFIYVLEGSIVMSVQSGEPTMLTSDLLRRPERCARHRAPARLTTPTKFLVFSFGRTATSLS